MFTIPELNSYPALSLTNDVLQVGHGALRADVRSAFRKDPVCVKECCSLGISWHEYLEVKVSMSNLPQADYDLYARNVIDKIMHTFNPMDSS